MTEAERTAKNRILAEALGWTNIRVEIRGQSSSVLYREVMVGDYLVGGVRGRELADFYGSLDASAATLPADALIFLNVMPDGENEANIGGDAYNGFTAYKGTGSTRAEALANAVLAWATATKGGAA